MSYLLIREFPELAAGQDPGGQPLAVLEPATLETQVTVSSIPVLFGPLQPTTKWVELCAQTTASILFGPSATLTSNSITTGNGRLNANDRVIRRVTFSPASQPQANPNQPQANALPVSCVICSST
jgi:hypothetical protein